MKVLAGDIGGTMTRLAVFDVHGTRRETVTERSYPSGDYSRLEDIVRDFLGGNNAGCRQAGFGIAGPVQRGRAQATNLPWILEEQPLAAMFGFEHVMLINIGLIGLAVMGQNLILNMADHGYQVAAYNRTTGKVDEFIAGPA
jgi:glucokinase